MDVAFAFRVGSIGGNIVLTHISSSIFTVHPVNRFFIPPRFRRWIFYWLPVRKCQYLVMSFISPFIFFFISPLLSLMWLGRAKSPFARLCRGALKMVVLFFYLFLS